MAVTQQVPEVAAVANGLTATFGYDFMIPTVEDLVVELDSVKQTGGFTVTGLGAGSGDITFLTPPNNGTVVAIRRVTALVRRVDYQTNGDFNAGVVNPDFDRAILALQEVRAVTDRTLKGAVGDPPLTLPSTIANPGKVLGTDGAGNLVFLDLPSGSTIAADLASSDINKGASLVTVKVKAGERSFSAPMLGLRVYNLRTRSGVTFDGGTDDTAQWNDAIARADAGQILELDGATTLVDRLTIRKQLHIQGSGRGSTAIRSNSPDADILRWETNLPIEARDFNVQTTVVRTGGASVVISGIDGSYNGGSIIENVDCPNAWVGFKLDNTATYTLRNLVAQGYLGAGIQVSNAAVPDAGDGVIDACTLVTQGIGLTAVGILQLSGGGLKVSNTKIIGGAAGFQLNLSAAVSTSILLFDKTNSIEACTVAAILLNAAAGSTFSKAHLSGQISVESNAIGIWVQDNGTQWLDVLSIDSHEITVGNNSTAIRLDRGGRVMVGPGQIIANGSNTTGVLLGANVGRIDIAPQAGMNGVTKPYDGPGLSNPMTFFSPPRMERGGFTGSTTAAYPSGGANFITPVQVIPFAQEFGQPPAVHATVFSAGGAVSPVINNVTRTGFEMAVIGDTSAGAVAARWTALG